MAAYLGGTVAIGNSDSIDFTGYTTNATLRLRTTMSDFVASNNTNFMNLLILDPSTNVADGIAQVNRVEFSSGNTNNFNSVQGVNSLISYNSLGTTNNIHSGNFIVDLVSGVASERTSGVEGRTYLRGGTTDRAFGVNAYVEDNSAPGNITGYAAAFNGLVDIYNGQTPYMAGVNVDSLYGGAGTVENNLGIYAGATNYAGGTINFNFGADFWATNTAGGNIDENYGLRVTTQSTNASSITSNYSLYVRTPSLAGSGTINNNYGLYIESQAGIGTINTFNIFSAGTSSRNLLEGELRVDGATDINNTLQIDLQNTASTTALCHSVNGQGASNTVLRDCTGTPAADYMEFYSVENGIEIGDIVVATNNYITTIDGDRLSKLTKSTQLAQRSVIGIASDKSKAGDFNSIGYNIRAQDNPWPIALSGRVQVKMDQNSVPILPGDPVTTSNIAGRGTKALGAGFIVGKALEEWTPGMDKVMVFVNYSYYNPNTSTNTASYFSLDQSNNLVANANLIINGQIRSESLAIGNNRLNIDLNGNLITSGNISAANITISNLLRVNDIVAKTLEIESIAIKSTQQDSLIGSATITAGNTNLIIDNSKITANSKVFITPKISTNANIAVTKLNAANGFEVTISAPQSIDVEFDYWIVEAR